MRKTILLAAAISLILLVFLMSCELSGMSDVEFAKALMEGSADSTELYSPPSKSFGSGDNGLIWDIVAYSEDPVGTYNWEILFTFTDYTPPFAPNSIVTGSLTAYVAIDTDEQTVTIDFDGGPLTVVGEHAGDYLYTAQLVIDLATGEYEYSGQVRIRDTVHEVTTK
jgi:hypothetical protein